MTAPRSDICESVYHRMLYLHKQAIASWNCEPHPDTGGGCESYQIESVWKEMTQLYEKGRTANCFVKVAAIKNQGPDDQRLKDAFDYMKLTHEASQIK